jgi:hypothetical protein
VPTKECRPLTAQQVDGGISQSHAAPQRHAIIGTVIGSAAMNAFAFHHHRVMTSAAVTLGIAIPALVYALDASAPPGGQP